MKPPLKKLRKFLAILDEIYGPVWMFALARRSVSFNVWDVLISAPWASRGDPKLHSKVNELLKCNVTAAERGRLGFVRFRDMNDPFVSQFFLRMGGVQQSDQPVHLIGPFAGDESLLEAYVIAATRPQASAARRTA